MIWLLARSVELWVGGLLVCNATPVEGGSLTAAHCVSNVPPGYVTTYAGRDLALVHVNNRRQPRRPPSLGEFGAIRAHNKTARVVFKGMARMTEHPSYYSPGGVRWMQVWCKTRGPYIGAGDSGSGIWLGDDLAGIVVAAGEWSQMCGTSEAVVAEGL